MDTIKPVKSKRMKYITPVITETRKKLLIVIKKLVQAAAHILVLLIMTAQTLKVENEEIKIIPIKAMNHSKGDVGALVVMICIVDDQIKIIGMLRIRSPILRNSFDLPCCHVSEKEVVLLKYVW
jgi:hypothetical protein